MHRRRQSRHARDRESRHAVVIVSVIIENLFLFSLLLLTLEFVDDLLLVLSSQGVFEVIHVKLMFQIVNIGELLDVHSIESFELGLKTLILLLVFWFDVLNTLQSLLGSLKLLLSSGELVSEFAFVKFELLDGVLHLSHFPCLAIDDISNTFFDVDLFGICV